jgi:flagellar basal-body rod modification protein FlgD
MDAISPYSALSTIGRSAVDSASIAENFDTFLTLLTTQLKNQNPLDPLDTNQFTQQLVQFTQVEQSVKANENLELLMQLVAGNTINSTIGYLGKEVTASGATATLTGGTAEWGYSAVASSEEATFTVFDAAGAQVYQEARPISAGDGVFTWNGTKSDGTAAMSGSYTLAISAKDSVGNQIAVTTGLTGVVDGVDMSGSEPILTVGGRQIKLEEVTAIKTPPL